MNYLVTLSILIVAIINNVQCNERCIRSPVLVGATPIISTHIVLESVDVGANDVKLNMTAEEGEGDNSIEECFLSVEIEDRSEIRPYWALSYESKYWISNGKWVLNTKNKSLISIDLHFLFFWQIIKWNMLELYRETASLLLFQLKTLSQRKNIASSSLVGTQMA